MCNWQVSRSRSPLYWIVSSIVVIILLLVIVGVYKESHRWNGPTPDKSQFSISFVTEPTKPVPSWLNHGNGLVVSITIKDWNTQYQKTSPHDGVYIIPTSTQSTQRLSFYTLPNTTPNGLQGTVGAGPSSFTDAVNKYFRNHNLARLQHGHMIDMTSIHGMFKDVSFLTAIGDDGTPKLQTKDIRLVILDIRAQGNQFKVMWAKVYAPTNV